MKRKNNNYLFDKIWYMKRDELKNNKSSDGFVFDGQGMIASSSTFKLITKADSQRKIE